jgi:hypothetical protein
MARACVLTFININCYNYRRQCCVLEISRLHLHPSGLASLVVIMASDAEEVSRAAARHYDESFRFALKPGEDSKIEKIFSMFGLLSKCFGSFLEAITLHELFEV